MWGTPGPSRSSSAALVAAVFVLAAPADHFVRAPHCRTTRSLRRCSNCSSYSSCSSCRALHRCWSMTTRRHHRLGRPREFSQPVFVGCRPVGHPDAR
ncbi:hypothetical protein PF007_g27752 [Phytophthora fragariae]|uniref:Secreted protein n=1 Tax=Phytophthora fragariae TaxID=53985 RepID=A0A6A3Q3C8_9STRA|nr:hypothetical protein PF007_g27752 [Phytophthora fragariae]